MFSQTAFSVFEQSIIDYHIHNDVNQPINNPFPKDKIEHLLYAKNWVDTVQWHYEDIIRDPQIDPVAAFGSFHVVRGHTRNYCPSIRTRSTVKSIKTSIIGIW